MIHKLALAVLMATSGLLTVAMGQPPGGPGGGAKQNAPSASVPVAAQGPNSTTVSVAGSWADCGAGITTMRIGIKYQPVAGDQQVTKLYDKMPPPAILATGNWAFTTPVNDF